MAEMLVAAAVSGAVVAAVLLVFAAARALSAWLRHPPWASPVLVAALVVALGLAGLNAAGIGISAPRFQAAAAPLRWLLGPALVALATVVHGNRGLLRRSLLPMLVAIAGGSFVGVASAIGMARLFGLDRSLTMALATKSVSTPFAVVIAGAGGASVPLAAALVVLTGVVGALCVPPLLDRLGITGAAARGLAIGVSSHIVGTDWLGRRDPAAGSVSALAMVVSGVLAAVVLPLVWGWIF
jgi:putative effector of murein hydrolase